MLEGQPLADGQKTIDVPQHDAAFTFTKVNDSYGTSGVSDTCFHDATAEVERQEYLANAIFEGSFNFDAYELDI